MLSYHHEMVYLVPGSHAYESNNMSIRLKAKWDKKCNYGVKPQLSRHGWDLQVLSLISYDPTVMKIQHSIVSTKQ